MQMDVTDNKPIRPMFVMSFSETLGPSRPFGNFYLELEDPQDFANLVKRQLPPKIKIVEWRKIEYTKTMTLESDPDLEEGWNRKYYCKRASFSGEKEWRLCASFEYCLPILNDTLKLRLSGVRGFFSGYGKHKNKEVRN